MPLTLYHHPTSQPSRTIIAFLKLNKIPYEERVVDIFNLEHRTAEYKKVNPMGTVPFIDDDGLVTWETEAIIKYLINTRKVGQEYYPEDPKTRLLVDRYFPFHHTVLRPNAASYFMATYSFLKPYCHFTSTKDEVRPNVIKACDQFVELFLKDQKYIAGDVLTIADIFAANELTHIMFSTDFDFNQVPVVKAYIERVLQDPVVAETQKGIKELPEVSKSLPKAKL